MTFATREELESAGLFPLAETDFKPGTFSNVIAPLPLDMSERINHLAELIAAKKLDPSFDLKPYIAVVPPWAMGNSCKFCEQCGDCVTCDICRCGDEVANGE